MWFAAVLYACSIFAMNWVVTRANVGWVIALPGRLAQAIFGVVQDPSTFVGALKQTGFHVFNLLFLYFVSALILRESRTKRQMAEETKDDG